MKTMPFKISGLFYFSGNQLPVPEGGERKKGGRDNMEGGKRGRDFKYKRREGIR